MYHPGDIVAPRGLQHVQRAFDIGADVAARRLVGVGDGDQRREVQDDLLPLDGSIHEVAVFDVAADDLDCLAHRLVKKGKIADERAGIVSNHGGDRGARRHERLDEMAADEATGAGYNDFLANPHRQIFAILQ